MNWEMDSKGVTTKDPNADLDYTVDWTEWLAPVSDTIYTSTWTVPARSGITAHSGGIVAGTQAVIWLRGGKVGGPYRIVNHIETADGRADDRSFLLTILEK